jgi:hypothetical protein
MIIVRCSSVFLVCIVDRIDDVEYLTEVEGNLNIAAALKNKTVHLFKGCNEMFTSHKSPFIF